MTSAPPDSPEQARVSALAAVARFERRRPVARSVIVVAPSAIRSEQTPAMMPPEPRRYTPVSLAVAPSVTWDDPAAGTALAAICAGIMAAVEGAGGAVNARGMGRPGDAYDVDRHVSGAR